MDGAARSESDTCSKDLSAASEVVVKLSRGHVQAWMGLWATVAEFVAPSTAWTTGAALLNRETVRRRPDK